jgi:hypothetical protein
MPAATPAADCEISTLNLIVCRETCHILRPRCIDQPVCKQNFLAGFSCTNVFQISCCARSSAGESADKNLMHHFNLMVLRELQSEA